MSWAKESAEAGLAGLSEREAARGALCELAFQLMPTPHVKRIIVVSKFKSRLILHVFNVEDVEDAYSSSVYLIQKEEKTTMSGFITFWTPRTGRGSRSHFLL